MIHDQVRAIPHQVPASAAINTPEARARIGAAAVYLLLALFTLSPLLWVSVPPLIDYPNHLARMWVLVEDGRIAALAQNYVVHWRLVPNLAMDLIIPPLAHVMPLEVAGRLFIAITMLGLFAGTAALHRVLHGSIGLWPLAALLFIYNAALYWGFLNCLFGIALYLLAFSAWIAARGSSPTRRIAIFSIVAILILVSHLFAFGLYVLSIGAYELEARFRDPRPAREELRSWMVVAGHLLPAAILLLISDRGQNYVDYGGLPQKVYALEAPTNFSGLVRPLDLVILGFACLALRYRSRLVLAPGMKLPLIVLSCVAVAIPNWLGGSWLADIRLPMTLPFLLIAATRWKGSARQASILATIALALLAVRVWTVSLTWRDYDRLLAEFRAASLAIAPGSRLLVVQEPFSEHDRVIPGVSLAFGARIEQNFHHLAALAVIDRSAFIPFLFTGLTSIEPAPRNRALARAQDSPLPPEALATSLARAEMGASATTPDRLGQLPYWVEWQKNFDYVVWLDLQRRPAPNTLPLELVAAGSFFQIYRVRAP